MGVGKGGEYRAVLADLNTKGRNCSLDKFGNNFHFYFIFFGLEVCGRLFWSIVSIEMSLIFELEKKRNITTTKKCKMLC